MELKKMENNIVQIKDLAEAFSGYAFAAEEMQGSTIPILKIGNIQNYQILKETDSFYDGQISEKMEKYVLQKDDFLIAMTGAGSVGRPGKMIEYFYPLLINQRVAIVRSNPKKVNPTFLFYFYSMEYVERYLYGLGIGAGQPNISADDILSLKVTFPPLPTQQKIASILSAYDNLIQNYKKQIEALQTAASELYKEWFVRFRFPGYQTSRFENGIPEGWKVERIGNVGEVIGGGTPSTENEEYWDGDIPWLSPVDLSDNTNVYVSRGGKNITKLGLQKSSAKMMPKDTVLLSSRAPIGYVALAKNPICTNQGFKSVVCTTSVIQPIYLYFYFRMNKNYLQSIASGATFPELSGSMMKKLKILLPPIELQQEFSKKANIFISKTELLSEQITNLTQQRDLLLPRLMSGKLEVE